MENGTWTCSGSRENDLFRRKRMTSCVTLRQPCRAGSGCLNKRKGTELAPRAFEPEAQPGSSCGSRCLQSWVCGDSAGARRVVADDARLVRAEPALAALSDYRRESRRGVGHNHRSASQVRDREVIAALHCCGRQNVVNQASTGGCCTGR